MKHKIFALILALTVVSWAQTATQTQAPPEKAKCACCEKTASADSKTSGTSCNRMGKDAQAASCCGAKDGMSCMKVDKNASGCKDGCGKDAKDKTPSQCCGGKCSSKDKAEHAGMSCCHHEKRG
jgi:hypothetical protein